jgi:hypothetical protein
MMAAKGGRIGFSEGGQTHDEYMDEMAMKVYKKPFKELTSGEQWRLEQALEEAYTYGSYAQGGRIGQMYGTGPQGLPGIPRMAPDGMEFDMRQNGGFQPLGAKEKKDDVPAMLAKNEFVFTADAVRGAGDGDVEKGAQRMYDTMQKLERRVV